MDYSELKPIFDEKTFDILANLTDNPTCELYLPNFEAVGNNTFDPFDNTSSDSTNITRGDKIFIDTLRCIYTFDKLVIQENDMQLGSKYTMVLYLRADDIPQVVFDDINSLIIKFDNIFYETSSALNLYNILLEFNLK